VEPALTSGHCEKISGEIVDPENVTNGELENVAVYSGEPGVDPAPHPSA